MLLPPLNQICDVFKTGSEIFTGTLEESDFNTDTVTYFIIFIDVLIW